MQDQDLEDVLRRYRPCDPPTSLRERCLAPPRAMRWPYAAAAALVLVALGTYRASATLQPRALTESADLAVAAELTDWLGASAEATQAATAAIVRFRVDEAARVAGVDGRTGSPQERYPQ